MPAAQPATSELSVQQLNHHFLLASYWLLSCCSAVDVVFDFSDALLVFEFSALNSCLRVSTRLFKVLPRCSLDGGTLRSWSSGQRRGASAFGARRYLATIIRERR